MICKEQHLYEECVMTSGEGADRITKIISSAKEESPYRRTVEYSGGRIVSSMSYHLTGIDFIEASQKMAQGIRMKRRCWKDIYCAIARDEPRKFLGSHSANIEIEDIQATDWVKA